MTISDNSTTCILEEAISIEAISTLHIHACHARSSPTQHTGTPDMWESPSDG